MPTVTILCILIAAINSITECRHMSTSMACSPQGYIFLLMAWRAKSKVITDQLWPTDPGLGISGLEVWHLSLNKAILQRLWDCVCLGNGSLLCLSGDTSVCQAFLLIRTRGYCELCSALILCHSLFMERHTPTRIYTKIISAQKQLFINGHEPPYL